MDKQDTQVPAVAQPQPPAVLNPEVLIAQAIDKGVPIETMERLLAMRRELRAEAAKTAFDEAMSRLQGEMPTIIKKKSVKDKNGKERYRYAPIDSIIEQTKEFIAKNGFSYAITTEQSEVDGEVKAICTVKHEFGHHEASTFRVPIDKEAYMTAPQKVGAALTFAKRYAFCNAFGIITGDEDTDATNVTPEPPRQQAKPAPAKPTQTPEQKLKVSIAKKLKELGKDIKDPNLPAWIKQATDLELVPANFGEIDARLGVLVEEKKTLTPKPPAPPTPPAKPVTSPSAPSGGEPAVKQSGQENQDGHTPGEAIKTGAWSQDDVDQAIGLMDVPQGAVTVLPRKTKVEEDDMTPEERAQMERVFGKSEPVIEPEPQEPVHTEPTVTLEPSPNEQKPPALASKALKPTQAPIKLDGEDLTKIKPSAIAIAALRGIMAQRLAIARDDEKRMVEVINERFGFGIKSLAEMNKDQEIRVTTEFIKTKNTHAIK